MGVKLLRGYIGIVMTVGCEVDDISDVVSYDGMKSICIMCRALSIWRIETGDDGEGIGPGGSNFIVCPRQNPFCFLHDVEKYQMESICQ